MITYINENKLIRYEAFIDFATGLFVGFMIALIMEIGAYLLCA